MPAKKANVEGASGPPPSHPKPRMTSNSLQAAFDAAESQPNAAEKVEALTQTFAAAMDKEYHGYAIPTWVMGMGVHGYGCGSHSWYP